MKRGCKKGSKKWPKIGHFGCPEVRGTPKTWHFGVKTSNLTCWGVKKWVIFWPFFGQKVGSFLDPFFSIFDTEAALKSDGPAQKVVQKWVQKVGQKWVILGYPPGGQKWQKRANREICTCLTYLFCHELSLFLGDFAILCSGSYLWFLAKNRPKKIN